MGKAVSAILSPITTLFGGDTPKAAPAPVVPAPTVMPEADDEAVRRARQRSIAAQRERSGRASTIFTDGQGETLGA